MEAAKYNQIAPEPSFQKEPKRDSKVSAARVVFIGGFGRSGSTLLDLILGSGENAFSVGELRYIWRRAFLEDQLCGCQQKFSQCGFWQEVVAQVWPKGRPSASTIEKMIDLQGRVDSARAMPKLMTKKVFKAQAKEWQLYTDTLLQLYKAIQNVSKRPIIIDSSKHFSHGYLLASKKEIHLETIHLIRDSRAVAYSWSKKVMRPEITKQESFMPQYSLRYSALEWLASNLLTENLKFTNNGYTRVNYENLMLDPDLIISLAKSLGIKKVSLQESRFRLGENHTLAGNPMRFKKGTIVLKADEAWRKLMPKADAQYVAALSSFGLVKYRYSLK